MKTTSAAACDLEAAVPASTAAAETEARTAAAAAPAASKVAEAEEQEEGRRPQWAFVRRVYAMLSAQLVLTAAFAATAGLVPAVPRFFAHGPRAAVWPTFVAALVSPHVVMFAMLKHGERERERERQTHPILLPLFTLCCGLTIDVFTLCCSLSIAVSAFFGTVADDVSSDDIVLLQATILAVLGLTLFAFWTAKRGYNCIYTFSTMLTGLIVVLPYIIIEIAFPLVMVAVAIFGLLVILVFSSFVVVVLDGEDDNDYGSSSGNDDDAPPAKEAQEGK